MRPTREPKRMNSGRQINRGWWIRWAWLATLWCCVQALAHKPSDSYLRLSVSNQVVTGQWDIAVRDLEFVLGIDADEDGQVTWGELKARHPDIAAFSLSRLKLRSDGQPLTLTVLDHLVATHTDGTYAVLKMEARAPSTPTQLEIEYRLFFELDPLHRGLLNLTWQGATPTAPRMTNAVIEIATNAIAAVANSDYASTNALEHNRVPPPSTEPGVLTAIFSPEQPVQAFTAASAKDNTGLVHYLKEGVHHIWIGTDHILFLLALLLPSVFLLGPSAKRTGPKWEHHPHRTFAPAFGSVFKVVTAFTAAHSITLTLAALGAVTLPSRFVESTIAASIVVAAWNNLRPFFRDRAWMVAFAFGLIHGFGFASVLTDLGLPKGTLVGALVAFNVGVELGQLAIVVAFLPLAFAFRKTWLYRGLVLKGGSLLVILIAAAWFVERAMDLKFMPF